MKTFPLGSYVCPKQMSVPNTFALYKFTQRKMSVPNTFALYKFTQRKMSVPNTFALCKFTQSEMSVPNKFIARRASMGRRRRPKCEFLKKILGVLWHSIEFLNRCGIPWCFLAFFSISKHPSKVFVTSRFLDILGSPSLLINFEKKNK